MNVSEAIDYRRSVRGFLDKSDDIALVKDVVARASRASLRPSEASGRAEEGAVRDLW